MIKKDYVNAEGEGSDDSDNPEGTEENEFYTDGELNEIMARDEKEYELFQKIDRERN